MKVKTYLGHNVPTGATYYNAANMLWPEAFYNHDATARNKVDSANGWMPHSGGLPTTAIELPEEEMKPDWLQIDVRVNTPKGVAVVNSISEDDGVYTSLGNFCRSQMSEYKDSVHHRPEIKPEAGDTITKASHLDEIPNHPEYEIKPGVGDLRSDPVWGDDIKRADNAIREIVAKNKPEVWVPAAGEECEYSQSPPNAKRVNWYKDTFIHKHGEHVWLGDSGLMHCKRLTFRPLKTQEEIDREAFILEGLTLQPVLTIEQAGIIQHALGLAFDAGFTAPKGESGR